MRSSDTHTLLTFVKYYAAQTFKKVSDEMRMLEDLMVELYHQSQPLGQSNVAGAARNQFATTHHQSGSETSSGAEIPSDLRDLCAGPAKAEEKGYTPTVDSYLRNAQLDSESIERELHQLQKDVKKVLHEEWAECYKGLSARVDALLAGCSIRKDTTHVPSATIVPAETVQRDELSHQSVGWHHNCSEVFDGTEMSILKF